MPTKTLLVIAGATAVGKTAAAIAWAKQLNCEIVSADSRQIYSELNIGVARPTNEELQTVPHHFIASHHITQDYNVNQYENEALACLSDLFSRSHYAILTGGSGFYIDAVCHGVSEMPDVDPLLRQELLIRYQKDGIRELQHQLKILDPVFYGEVDLCNPMRLLRGLEVCLQTGKPYSSFRNHAVKERPFRIVKVVLFRPRPQLYARIDHRVDAMMQAGLLAEVQSLYAFRSQNALNTVGYKELFHFLDGTVSLEQAVADIKTHSRRYAKRQETWFRRDHSYRWLPADQTPDVLCLLNS